MKLKEVDGSLLSVAKKGEAIAHGCNCEGSMGGLASKIAKKWPGLAAAYKKACSDGAFTLGSVLPWHDPKGGIWIYNLATQQHPGADARLGAIRDSLGAAITVARKDGVHRIYLPRIGAGIGGLQWSDVRAVLKEAAEACDDVELVVVTPSAAATTTSATEGAKRVPTIKFFKENEDHGEFSNFASYPVMIDGLLWPTSEHYFQAQKHTDPDQRERVRLSRSPHDAWASGKGVKKPGWLQERDEVMRRALRAKFTQYPHLRAALLDTGEALLVEHSNDKYWADGLDGTGKNRLGHLLMELRDEWR